MRERVRYLAAFLVFALVAASCTDSDTVLTTTSSFDDSTTTPVLEPEAVSINSALGGTQAVQDFVIHLEMWKETPDGPDSFYGDLLAQARTGNDETLILDGGFLLTPLVAPTGRVVDEEGLDLPSLSLDLALFGLSEDRRENTKERLVAELAASGATEFSRILETASDEPHDLLIEIVTADYKVARTHATPGDRAAIDLTSVSTIAPGDEIRALYVFGQTLPGLAEDEEGLTPLELFHYRWNLGLVSVLGEDGAPIYFHDREIRAVEGSTLTLREIKSALLEFGFLTDLAEGAEVGDDRFDAIEQQVQEAEDADLAFAEVDLSTPGAEGLGGVGLFGGDGEVFVMAILGDDEVVKFDRPGYTQFFATHWAITKCLDTRLKMRKRNNEAKQEQYEALKKQLEQAQQTQGAAAEEGAGTDDDQVEVPEPDPKDDEPEFDCFPPPSPDQEPDPPPKLPTGDMVGDIHIHTIDGNHYSNQAAGEFLLFENDATSIQVRTEPWGDSDVVSVATALAFVIGDLRISVHAGGETRIDGETVKLDRGVPTAVGRGELLWWHGGWVVVWPDGTILRVHERDVALVASVTPSSGPTIGLLGDNDGDPDNDLTTRGGEVLAADADEDFDFFYDTYVESWRITNDESLFSYDEGESPATFTIEGFPAELVTADDLPQDVFAEAQFICTELGVTAEEVVDNCILDVAMTGDPEFAYDAYLAQESMVQPFEGDASHEVPGVSGEGDSTLAIGDLTIAFGADPPIQDPSGPAPKWTCESADDIYTAISVYSETPTIRYELDLQFIGPDNSRGFDEGFRLTVLRNSEPYAWVWTNAEQFADSVDTVSVDGDVLTAAGEMFLNEPLQSGLQPISPLPAGTELDPFELRVSCGE